MSEGVKIVYGNIAPGAKENFTPSASESEFNTLNQLQKYNLNFPNYGNPCETYATVLDGETELLPSSPNTVNIGMISESISEADGTFATPIVLTLTSIGQYTSPGFTLTFDTYNNIFVTDATIVWYRVVGTTEEFLGSQSYTQLKADPYKPNSASFLYLNPSDENVNVSNFNKIVMTFNAINMPYNRLRLRCIDYGYGTVFYGDELRNVKVNQYVDPISSELRISSVDFTLDSKSDVVYDFQVKQSIDVYYNNILRATNFVKSSKRTAKFLWDVQTEDYIGLLDSISYPGIMYITDNQHSAKELFKNILDTANVPYIIDNYFNTVAITGYIPYTTCREALLQVAIACGAIIDTSNSDKVKIYAPNSAISQTIPLNRIMQGQSFSTENTVTAIRVSAHTYSRSEDTMAVYKASDSGTGSSIFVRFSEPLYNLEYTPSDPSNFIREYGPNYAIISAGTNDFVLTGKKYTHTVTQYEQKNTVVSVDSAENIKSIEKATLIRPATIDRQLPNGKTWMQNCFDWLTRTQTTNLNIVEGKDVTYHGKIKYGQKKYGKFRYGEDIGQTIVYDTPVNVGDKIKAETQYTGIVESVDEESHYYTTGTITKQSYNLNGNIIVKECEMK